MISKISKNLLIIGLVFTAVSAYAEDEKKKDSPTEIYKQLIASVNCPTSFKKLYDTYRPVIEKSLQSECDIKKNLIATLTARKHATEKLIFEWDIQVEKNHEGCCKNILPDAHRGLVIAGTLMTSLGGMYCASKIIDLLTAMPSGKLTEEAAAQALVACKSHNLTLALISGFVAVVGTQILHNGLYYRENLEHQKDDIQALIDYISYK